jgi:hypothetical protein
MKRRSTGAQQQRQRRIGVFKHAKTRHLHADKPRHSWVCCVSQLRHANPLANLLCSYCIAFIATILSPRAHSYVSCAMHHTYRSRQITSHCVR